MNTTKGAITPKGIQKSPKPSFSPSVEFLECADHFLLASRFADREQPFMPSVFDKMLARSDSETPMLAKLSLLGGGFHVSHVVVGVCLTGLILLVVDYARMLLLRRKMVLIVLVP